MTHLVRLGSARFSWCLRCLALALSCLLPAQPAFAQPTLAQSGTADRASVPRSDIIRLLAALPDYADFRSEMRTLGFRGEKLDLAVAHAELIYRDPVIAGYVADRVIAAYGAPETGADARGLIGPLIERGLPHMSTAELGYYHRVEKLMMEALPVRDCGRIMRNRMPPVQFVRVMSRMAARLNTAGLRNYYRLQAKAARHGVTRPPVRLSRARMDAVETRIAEALATRIAQSDSPRVMQRAIGNLPGASNARACAIGRMFMDIVADMEGQEQRDALLYLSLPSP